MKVIRTFVAVLIAEDLKKKMSEVQEQVKKLAPDVKWVAPENFHVTMKFLGSVREDELAEVCAAVEEAVSPFSPFELSISGLGAFPSPARARVVWIGIEKGREQLSGLASAIDERLAGLGFEKEDKAFKAHVTIGRVKTSRFLKKLAEEIGSVDADNLGTQQVSSVVIMQSELLREGPVYSPLSVCKLSEGDL